MDSSTIIVIVGLTGMAAIFLTWNKVWKIAKTSIGADVQAEQDKRCNKRINDLTAELKEAILPMSEDVTIIRSVTEGLKVDHATIRGDVKQINATMTAMQGHLDAVDKKAGRAEVTATNNSIKIAGLSNGN